MTNDHEEDQPNNGALQDADYSLNEFGETVNYVASPQTESTADVAADSDRVAIPKAIGRYEIRSILGQGCFGAVYLGYDSQLDRQVAIKIPLINMAGTSAKDVEAEFLQEARQLAKLTHPNIVTVFDMGVEENVCYIVSDYLDGPDLNHWLKGHTPNWQETTRVVASVCDGLATAHASGTIHRDVKPANIIMTQRVDGVVPVLVDFGLALSEASMAAAGERGRISGTPNYMSPEQAKGEGHRIDGRTDIYGIGVLLYRMVSGKLPFKAPSVRDLLRAVINDEPQPPRQFVHGIPRELERICLKAMSKQISDRYTTIGDLAAELRTLLRQHEAELEAAKTAVVVKERAVARDAAKILIADDDELSRFKLQTDLEKWGHEVTAAEDGEQAWQLFQKGEFSIVITDWMMPNVDGLELVRRIRDAELTNYVYVIMLTAKKEKHDIVTGMGAGSDDFLAKPFHRDELQIRLHAGMRITNLNRELNDTNRRMARSQEAAAQIQRSFLPTAKPDVPGLQVAWDHRSTNELGGDMFNFVRLDDKQFGFYVLDVTGEGVPAALLATSLSRILLNSADPQSILVERGNDELAGFRILEPAEVAKRLNQRFVESLEGKQYFTLTYGVLNVESRAFRFTSAGHPPLLHQSANSSPAMLDISGFPIGMAPATEEFGQKSIVLEAGDRLLAYSDGLTDTMNDEGEVYGAARLLDCVTSNRQLSLDEMVTTVMSNLGQWRGEAELNDHVSMLAVEVK